LLNTYNEWQTTPSTNQYKEVKVRYTNSESPTATSQRQMPQYNSQHQYYHLNEPPTHITARSKPWKNRYRRCKNNSKYQYKLIGRHQRYTRPQRQPHPTLQILMTQIPLQHRTQDSPALQKTLATVQTDSTEHLNTPRNAVVTFLKPDEPMNHHKPALGVFSHFVPGQDSLL
jgi:hypothetical protein